MMTDSLKFLQFLHDSKAKKSIIVEEVLADLGYEGFHQKFMFLQRLKQKKYVDMRADGPDPYKVFFSYDENGDVLEMHESTEGPEPNFYACITRDGEDFLVSELRTIDSLKTSRRSVYATWFGGIIAVLSIVINIFQGCINSSKDVKIQEQERIIKEQKVSMENLQKHNKIW